MKRKFIKAFTLTELMAVVIIIALLSGVAAGTYRKAVERSRVSDGLTAASNVLGALERYYVEHPDIRDTAFTSYAKIADALLPERDKLDLSFANQKACTFIPEANRPYCFKTKYFETVYHNDGRADAVRTIDTNSYTIRVHSNIFGANLRQAPQCLSQNEQGRDLCVSAGYTSCSLANSVYTCVRP